MGGVAGLIGAILLTLGCREVLGSPTGTMIGAGISLMLFGIFDKVDDALIILRNIRDNTKKKV